MRKHRRNCRDFLAYIPSFFGGNPPRRGRGVPKFCVWAAKYNNFIGGLYAAYARINYSILLPITVYVCSPFWMYSCPLWMYLVGF